MKSKLLKTILAALILLLSPLTMQAQEAYASLKGGNGTAYDRSYTDATYAHPDAADKPGYFTKFVLGDANGDGKVTITDAVAVVNYILNTTQGTFNVTAADVDGNGSITITDAVGIVNIILNSSSPGSLPDTYVDMGEGQLWATMNIGASSETEVGSYFAWGETDSKTSYGWNNYAWGESATSLTKYVLQSSYGTVDGLSVLASSDDAATSAWGGDWRTPTMSEWRWLYSNCDRAIETVDGVTGFRFTSRIEGYTSNSIFIPAAKYYDGSSLVEDESKVTFYWSSSLDSGNNGIAESMGLSQTYDILNGITANYRYVGLPIRAVCTPPTSVTGIELSNTSLAMKLGDSPFTLGATVLPANATNQTVLWSSSDESVASIYPNGQVCTIGAAGVGEATITATTADGGHVASCVVTVSGVMTTGVTLDKTELLLIPSETYQLTATVLPANASIKTVTWSSSNPDVVYVDENGKVTALAENGTSTITATTVQGGHTATCEVTVEFIHVTSVTLNKTELTIPCGSSETLTATLLPENATLPLVIWSSSDESVAKVSDDGTVTAMAERGGTATITASCEGGKVTATCSVTVTVPVTGVVLQQETVTVYVGGSYKLAASVRPIYATNQTIIFSSSNTSIATVDSDGTVHGLALGKATLTATSEDGGFKATCQVTVATPEINGHAFVEMGVRSADGRVLKWATMNVGATQPEEYGDYFAWGETAAKTDYSWETYNWIAEGYTDWKGINKYTFADNQTGVIWYNGNTFVGDGKTSLKDYDYVDDAAHQNWKGTWRTPTDEEWTWLRTNCTWTWTDDYLGDGTNVKGMIVTSKVSGYEGNTIFLPAAGLRRDTSLDFAGSIGYYWSSSLGEFRSYRARYVYFDSGKVDRYYFDRYLGFSVRPVSE